MQSTDLIGVDKLAMIPFNTDLPIKEGWIEMNGRNGIT